MKSAFLSLVCLLCFLSTYAQSDSRGTGESFKKSYFNYQDHGGDRVIIPPVPMQVMFRKFEPTILSVDKLTVNKQADTHSQLSDQLTINYSLSGDGRPINVFVMIQEANGFVIAKQSEKPGDPIVFKTGSLQFPLKIVIRNELATPVKVLLQENGSYKINAELDKTGGFTIGKVEVPQIGLEKINSSAR